MEDIRGPMATQVMEFGLHLDEAKATMDSLISNAPDADELAARIFEELTDGKVDYQRSAGTVAVG